LEQKVLRLGVEKGPHMSTFGKLAFVLYIIIYIFLLAAWYTEAISDRAAAMYSGVILLSAIILQFIDRRLTKDNF
jgi:hypothetical protein